MSRIVVRTLSVKKIPLIPRRTRSPVSIGRSNRTGCAKWTQHFRAFVLHHDVNRLLGESFNDKPQASSPPFRLHLRLAVQRKQATLISTSRSLRCWPIRHAEIGQQAPVYAGRLLSKRCRPSVASPQPSCRILRILNGAPCTQCGDRRPFPSLSQNTAAVLTN